MRRRILGCAFLLSGFNTRAAFAVRSVQPFRGKVSFCATRFGNYLIGTNASDDIGYELKTYAGFTSAPVDPQPMVHGWPSLLPGSG